MGPPEPMLAAIHDSAANHHHVACGPAPNLLCKPAAAQPVSAYQAFAREQRPLLSGSLARRETEKVLRQRWKALSKPEKGRYQTNGVERRNVARSPYNMFCQAQRPFLSPELRNSQREAALGQLWRVGGDPRGGEGPTSWPFKKRKGGNKAYILGKSYKTLFSRVY